MKNSKRSQGTMVERKYVGTFAGLHFLRTVLRAALEANFGDKSNWEDRIIVVERIPKPENLDSCYVHTYKKKIKLGRRTITDTKREYYNIVLTPYNSFEPSIEPMPCRIKDEHGNDWVIPSSAIADEEVIITEDGNEIPKSQKELYEALKECSFYNRK